MTAPTPDVSGMKQRIAAATHGPWRMTTQGGIEAHDYSGPGEDCNSVAQTREEGDWEFIAHAREDIPALLDALAAMTAKRDQAVRELAEQKRINASNLRVMTLQLDQARQMLTDAPHGLYCGQFDLAHDCTCWKAGL